MKEWEKSRTFSDSVRHAWRGVRFVLRREPNLRRQIVLGAAAFVLAMWLRISSLDLAVLMVVSALVITLEMANSALEQLLDLVHPEYHHAIRHAKDAAAGAVMVASVAAVVVGLLLLGPPLVALFR